MVKLSHRSSAIRGFIDYCNHAGVDPALMLKRAQSAEDTIQTPMQRRVGGVIGWAKDKVRGLEDWSRGGPNQNTTLSNHRKWLKLMGAAASVGDNESFEIFRQLRDDGVDVNKLLPGVDFNSVVKGIETGTVSAGQVAGLAGHAGKATLTDSIRARGDARKAQADLDAERGSYERGNKEIDEERSRIRKERAGIKKERAGFEKERITNREALSALERANADALERQRLEGAKEIANLNMLLSDKDIAHAGELDARDRSYADTIAGMRVTHAGELDARDKRHAGEMTTQKGKYDALDAALGKYKRTTQYGVGGAAGGGALGFALGSIGNKKNRLRRQFAGTLLGAAAGGLGGAYYGNKSFKKAAQAHGRGGLVGPHNIPPREQLAADNPEIFGPPEPTVPARTAKKSIIDILRPHAGRAKRYAGRKATEIAAIAARHPNASRYAGAGGGALVGASIGSLLGDTGSDRRRNRARRIIATALGAGVGGGLGYLGAGHVVRGPKAKA